MVPSKSSLIEYLWRELRLGRMAIRLLLEQNSQWEHLFSLACGNPEAILKGLPKKFLIHSPKFPKALGENPPPFPFLTQADIDFPLPLRESEDPPWVLYYSGDVKLIRSGQPKIAVVGTRRASEYALEITSNLVSQMVPYQAAILSGLALGVDGAAHRQALAQGLSSWAVMGTPLDRAYPRHHQDLFDRLQSEGLILSELFPGAPQGKFRFPERNRILAALCHALVVVEAPESSGALITASEALNLGREVFVVPGPLHPEFNAGGHRLIQEGARLLRDGKEIFEVLRVALPSPHTPLPEGEGQVEGALQKKILNILSSGPRHIDKIIHISQKPAPQVSAALTELTLMGQVRERWGKVYKKI
jgi:DNA processing protein